MFFLSSCTGLDIVGKYSSGNSQKAFEFKSDSNYVYEFRAFHYYEYSSGKWVAASRKKVVLNSNISDLVIPLKVEKVNDKRVSNSNTVFVDFNIANGNLSDYQCRVFINDSIYAVRRNMTSLIRCDSLSKIQIDSPLKSIYFQIIDEPEAVNYTYISPPLVSQKYVADKDYGNNLKIELEFSDSFFFYVPFKNQVVVKGKNKIKWITTGNKRETIPKVSDDSVILSDFYKRRNGVK